jgi:serine/threonine protein kinase
MEERLRLAVEFAEGVCHLHNNGIISNDLSTRNTLLFESEGRLHIKLCDFGCAYRDGRMGDEMNDGGVHESRYEILPRGRITWEIPMMVQELFAMGSEIFEITEWKVPYADAGDDSGKVRRWVYDGKLPTISPENPASAVISKCWAEGYTTSEDILRDLSTCSEGEHKAIIETRALPEN